MGNIRWHEPGGRTVPQERERSQPILSCPFATRCDDCSAFSLVGKQCYIEFDVLLMCGSTYRAEGGVVQGSRFSISFDICVLRWTCYGSSFERCVDFRGAVRDG